MNLSSGIRRLVRDLVLRNPTGDPNAQLSMIYPNGGSPPTPRLFDLAMDSTKLARTEDLSAISARMATTPRWPDLWPGEHYKLLAGMVRVMQPALVVEIGTYLGLSALTLAKHLPAGGKLVTYDVIPYERIPGHVLNREDFASGQLEQRIADLTDPAVAEAHRALFESADLIFVDAAKDGRMEQTFLDWFGRLKFQRTPIIVFDDIRVWNMVGIWRGVTRPKLDLTSFGHFSGTGLIDWNG